jgi:hypothetical protein
MEEKKTVPFSSTGWPFPPTGSGPDQGATAPEPLDPVHPTGPEQLYFVTHANLPAREGWWEVRVRELLGAQNFIVAEFFADVVPNAEMWARNIATELNELATQKKGA